MEHYVEFMSDEEYPSGWWGMRLWLNRPEYLTWWKRSIERLIEDGSAELPYPWGDRLESTIGNFGIWVQLTVAILIFRAILGIMLLMIRTMRKRKR